VSGPIPWTKDSNGLYFTANDDRRLRGKAAVAGNAVDKVTTGRRAVSSISLGDDGAITMLAGTATEPGEVHALEAGNLRKLTRVNDALFAELQLGLPRTSRRRARTARW
jgi:dipeptidyl aminopeptidase/acylaminoacyl peptidase